MMNLDQMKNTELLREAITYLFILRAERKCLMMCTSLSAWMVERSQITLGSYVDGHQLRHKLIMDIMDVEDIEQLKNISDFIESTSTSAWN